ncbi:hypothetical protein J6590_055061 [Homalodisca vitripennis]|nr:hypothetical protein J6590_055061 [Homalodisca vitripennis]
MRYFSNRSSPEVNPQQRHVLDTAARRPRSPQSPATTPAQAHVESNMRVPQRRKNIKGKVDKREKGHCPEEIPLATDIDLEERRFSYAKQGIFQAYSPILPIFGGGNVGL